MSSEVLRPARQATEHVRPNTDFCGSHRCVQAVARAFKRVPLESIHKTLTQLDLVPPASVFSLGMMSRGNLTQLYEARLPRTPSRIRTPASRELQHAAATQPL